MPNHKPYKNFDLEKIHSVVKKSMISQIGITVKYILCLSITIRRLMIRHTVQDFRKFYLPQGTAKSFL